MHILPNISRSKDNQAIKFGQLIECNMRNIFLENSYTKSGGEAIPRPLKSKLSIALDWNTTHLFLVDALIEVHQNILKTRYLTLSFI